MCLAVRLVRIGEVGYLRASKYYSLPRGTLERYATDTFRSPEELVNMHLGRITILPSEHENKLVEYCITMDQRYCGLRRQDIMAFQLAIRNGLKHPFNQEKSAAGNKWLRSISKRHPVLSLRTPEGISAARVKGFTSENVARSFDICESELRKVNHKARRIFNVDATGITAVQYRQSYQREEQERIVLSNIGRKRKSNHCCHLCEFHWNIRSTTNRVPEKKYERGTYGWSTGRLNFGLTS